MKCPQCGFVSFNGLAQCKKCGVPFKEPAATAFNEREAPKQSQEEYSADPAATLPPHWSETIQSIKKELEEIEGAPVDKQSHMMNGYSEEPQKCHTPPAPSETHTPASAPLFERNIVLTPKGGFLLRLLAYLIDTIVLMIIILLLIVSAMMALKRGTVMWHQADIIEIMSVYMPAFMIAALLIEIFYFTYCHGVTGQTVGKWVCGLRVVNKNAEPLGLGRAFVRWLGYWVSSLFFGLGFMWIIFSKQKQGWHDKIAGSYVIRV